MNMSKSPISIGHHTVSACYLRNFLGEKENKLYVGQRSKSEYYQQIPEKISIINNFNTIKLADTAPDTIENMYSGLEGRFNTAAKEVIAKGYFTNKEDKIDILTLLAIFYIRNPRFRRIREEFYAKLIKKSIANDPQIPNEEMKKLVLTDQVKVNISQNKIIADELDSLGNALYLLLQRNWTVVNACKWSNGFITSDHPASLVWTIGEVNQLLPPPTLADEHTEFICPLSHRHALLGTFKKNTFMEIANERDVWRINGITIKHAQQKIYAKDLNFWYHVVGDIFPKKGINLLLEEIFKQPSFLDAQSYFN